jgi:hypothetical protein
MHSPTLSLRWPLALVLGCAGLAGWILWLEAGHRQATATLPTQSQAPAGGEALAPRNSQASATTATAHRAPRRTEASPQSVHRPALDADDFRTSPPKTIRTVTRALEPTHGRIRQPGAAEQSRWPRTTTIAPPSASLGERVFDLGPGMQAPAAVMPTDPALPLTPRQETLKAGMARDFLAVIDRVQSDPAHPPELLGDTWIAAQRRADERFRLMFGDAAYLRQSAAAARAALPGRE